MKFIMITHLYCEANNLNFQPVTHLLGLFYKQACHSFNHSLINSSFSSNIFQKLSVPNRKSQGAGILRECSSHTMCHMYGVTCHLSCVTCRMSPVTCHMSPVTCQKKITFFFVYKKKLDGVGPVDNRPSTEQLHHFVQFL